MVNGEVESMNYDLTDLSIGERFWLDRLKRSENQIQAAKRHGIAERRYRHIENGKRPPDPGMVVPAKLSPWVGAKCKLARRRDGRNLRTLGLVLGAGSHVSLLERETMGSEDLVAAWKRVGFCFT